MKNEIVLTRYIVFYFNSCLGYRLWALNGGVLVWLSDTYLLRINLGSNFKINNDVNLSHYNLNFYKNKKEITNEEIYTRKDVWMFVSQEL